MTIVSQSAITVSLPAGRQLSVVADAISSGVVVDLGEKAGDAIGASTAVAASQTKQFGPHTSVRRYRITASVGSLSYSDAAVDFQTASEAVADAESVVAAIIQDATGDFRIITGDGAPVDYTDGDPAATGEAVAGKGSLYVNLTNGTHWRNSGTKAQPVWTQLADAA